MVALVTGGSGFIGRHLVAALLERGEAVRVLDVEPSEALPRGAEFIRGSVTDGVAVGAAMHGVRRVYHLAANANLWVPDRGVFEAVNHGGTRTVLAAAGKAGVERIVVTSTEGVLIGKRSPRRPFRVDETAELTIGDMIGAYCRAKYRAEKAALVAARDGMPVVVVNPTLPVGPGDRRLTPPTRMILDLANGTIPAYLDCYLNFIDVRDAAAGHILAAEKGRIGARYILGGENLRMRDFIAVMAEVTGASVPHWRVPYWLAVAAATVDEARSTYVTKAPPKAPLAGVRLAGRPALVDNTRARTELGLPSRPIRDSLRDALAWLVWNGLVERPLPNLAVA
ncbi:MAG: hypothetical protein CMM50_00055 [Rhodospirillaceae bacterium]|nr:hypothetical protein [Rhodospirillaceae bacterium]